MSHSAFIIAKMDVIFDGVAILYMSYQANERVTLIAVSRIFVDKIFGTIVP